MYLFLGGHFHGESWTKKKSENPCHWTGILNPSTKLCLPRSKCKDLFVVSCKVVSSSATPRTATCQAPLPIEFSSQGYWSGLPFLSAKDLYREG